MKRLVCLLLGLALIGCSGGSGDDSAGGEPQGSTEQRGSIQVWEPPSGVASYVNDVEIPSEDCLRIANSITQNQIPVDPRIEGDSEQERVFNSARRILENQVLIVEAAAEIGITAPEAEVNAQLSRIQMQSGGIEAFNTQIAAQGVTIEDVKREIENQMVTTQYFNQVTQAISVTPEEIKEFYDTSGVFGEQEQVRARHILKAVDPNADQATHDAAISALEELKKRIEGGESFEELAKTESEGPSAPNGGDLGYFNRGIMVPTFDAAVFALGVGQVSDVVQTQFGYHLILVEDKRTAPSQTLEEASAAIEGQLLNQKRQEFVESHVEELRAAATIRHP